MCNQLHEDSVDIPNEGRGWKFFTVNKYGKVLGFIYDMSYVIDIDNKSVIWNNSLFTGLETNDNGFCFFLKKLSPKYQRHVYDVFKDTSLSLRHKLVLPIIYHSGMGKHIENRFTSKPVEVALCKEFKLAPEAEDMGFYL